MNRLEVLVDEKAALNPVAYYAGNGAAPAGVSPDEPVRDLRFGVPASAGRNQDRLKVGLRTNPDTVRGAFQAGSQ